jgi:4,4'-diaponeurosporenoate glycosyltransferase
MLVFGLIMVILALAGGSLMLWRIQLPRKYRSLDNLSMDIQLSVIIPARNEEKRLPPLLSSLRAQDYLPAEVIVVDDDSGDATASVALEYGVRVISAKRQENWVGKSYACWTGALAAMGNFMLFLDADTRLDHPDSLRRLMLTFKKQGSRGILSVQPYHRVRRIYENLSAVFNIIVLAGMNIFTPWGRKLRIAGAFGPCILCRKDEYLSAGGHAAIRGSIVDDLDLGNLFLKKGFPVRGYGGRGLIHFSMYPEGFANLVEGWTKNFASGAGRTHPLVMLMIVFWIGGAFSSTALLVYVILLGNAAWIATSAILYLAYMLQMLWLAWRAGNFYPLCLIIYPILHLFFIGLFVWSLFQTKVLHLVNWRGRRIKI